jgi:hypothetical protein
MIESYAYGPVWTLWPDHKARHIRLSYLPVVTTTGVRAQIWPDVILDKIRVSRGD